MSKDSQLVAASPQQRDAPLFAWVILLIGAAAACAGVATRTGWGIGNVWTVAALAVVAAFAETQRIRLSNALEESISLVPTLFAAVVFGPLAAMIVGAASFAGELRRPYLKWATYTPARAITAGIAGFLASAVMSSTNGRLEGIVLATAVAAIVLESLDIALGLVTIVLRRHDARRVAVVLWPLVLVAVPLYAPLVAVLAYAYLELSKWSVVLFLAPAFAAQRLFALYQAERKLTHELVQSNTQLERANLSFASALVATLDARDQYTAGHSAAVAIYARDIAGQLGLSSADQQLAHLCGLVHDIGKIGLPAGLLEKPGPLTLEERRQMEQHSEIGERILANVESYGEIARIVRHHHERWDGEGYPDRLAATDIPLISRIIAVADAYNAMTSDRPYRDAMPSHVARLRLKTATGSQFDDAVVGAFEAILSSAQESYCTGRREDFSFSRQNYRTGDSLAAVA